MGNRKNRRKAKRAGVRILNVPPKAQKVADRLGYGNIIAYLKHTFELAASIEHRLRNCSHFQLLDEEHLIALENEQQKNWFWRQLNELLILLSRSNARATVNVIEGFCWSLGNTNELMLAYSGRALLEHAVAYNYITTILEPMTKRIVDDVWPNRGTDSPHLDITSDDEELRRTLIRFAVGRVVELGETELPLFTDKNERWREFTKSLKNAHKQFTPPRIGEMIDAASQTPGQHHLRPVYNLLSEYCHPNSASRTLDFNVEMTEFGKHVLFDPKGDVSIGLLSVFGLCRSIVTVACRLIENGLHVLSNSHKPLGKFDGSTTPFPGALRIVDESGRHMWVERSKVAWLPKGTGESLTDDQRTRIKKIHDVLKHVDPMPLELSLDLFASEGPAIEEEIALWERFVIVFQDEVSLRKADEYEHKFLFSVIYEASKCASVDELVVVHPYFEGFPHLRRVVDKLKK